MNKALTKAARTWVLCAVRAKPNTHSNPFTEARHMCVAGEHAVRRRRRVADIRWEQCLNLIAVKVTNRNSCVIIASLKGLSPNSRI